MGPTDFEEFLERAIPRRAERFVARGIWAGPEAPEASRRLYEKAFPQGLATPNQHLCRIVDSSTDARVGEAWYTTERQGGTVQFWVEWISIDPPFRRRGYATAALRRLEEEARKLGATRIGLLVWEDNPGAVELYRKLGYSTASRNMVKPLSASS